MEELGDESLYADKDQMVSKGKLTEHGNSSVTRKQLVISSIFRQWDIQRDAAKSKMVVDRNGL